MRSDEGRSGTTTGSGAGDIDMDRVEPPGDDSRFSPSPNTVIPLKSSFKGSGDVVALGVGSDVHSGLRSFSSSSSFSER